MKLVFVAAATLALTALAPPFSARSLGWPRDTRSAPATRAEGSESWQAMPDRPPSIFERRPDAMANRQNNERRLSPGPVIGLICAIVASSVALGIAFGVRRRIDRIAGPDPEKEDD